MMNTFDLAAFCRLTEAKLSILNQAELARSLASAKSANDK